MKKRESGWAYSVPRFCISWALTPLYLLLFFCILVVFQPLQILARSIGYSAHVAVYYLMNFCLVANFRVMGTRLRVSSRPLPTDRPLLIISNHQSMYDIPFLNSILYRNHPRFVAKLELARGLPSISYALRTLEAALIDRSNPRQAIPVIREFGSLIAKLNYSACIFPEGTRARDGKMKSFKPSGVKALLESMPNVLVVPVAIHGSWEMVRYNLLPVPFGVKVDIRVLEPIEPRTTPAEELTQEVENRIRAAMQSIDSALPQQP